MEKLELRQIAPFLPYGLIIKVNDGYGKLIGIDQNLLDVADPDSVDSGMYVRYDECKPLLIPLESLTEDQWIEVFKAGCEQFGENFTVEIENDWVTMDQCYDISTFDFRWKEFKISHHMPPFNALASLQKLYELHADVEDLIGKGLAINKLEQ